jgi:Gram-negative bacterial TonB protein C-terminal
MAVASALISTIPSRLLSQTIVPYDPAEAWPTTQPTTILTQPDWSDPRVVYPKEVRNREGKTGVQVLVGTDGVPKKCRITYRSGSPILDANTCDLMFLIRFAPTSQETAFVTSITYKVR